MATEVAARLSSTLRLRPEGSSPKSKPRRRWSAPRAGPLSGLVALLALNAMRSVHGFCMLGYNGLLMSHHITINGHTYTSVDVMPPEVRRQYEAAMQTLAGGGGKLSRMVADSEVDIATQGGDPMQRPFETVTKMTANRIVVNGKEYGRWEDVPAEARVAFQKAGGQRAGRARFGWECEHERGDVGFTAAGCGRGGSADRSGIIALIYL